MTIALDLVGIATNDVATSLRFYRVLGLTIPEGSDGEAHAEATVVEDPDGNLLSLFA